MFRALKRWLIGSLVNTVDVIEDFILAAKNICMLSYLRGVEYCYGGGGVGITPLFFNHLYFIILLDGRNL